MKDRAYKIALTGLLTFSAVALGWTAWLYLKPRPVVSPTKVVQRAFICLRLGDLLGFTEYFIPTIRDRLRGDPGPFKACWPAVKDDDIDILGETVEGEQASVKARYRIVVNGQARFEDVVHTLRWDGERWRIQHWRVPFTRKIPAPVGEPKEELWELT